jgi:hypothetical protein
MFSATKFYSGVNVGTLPKLLVASGSNFSAFRGHFMLT